jgi:hypothetical protein
LPGPVSDYETPTSISQVAGNTGVNHHNQLVFMRQGLTNFCASWPDPLTFTFQVARITGMNHYTQLAWEHLGRFKHPYASLAGRFSFCLKSLVLPSLEVLCQPILHEKMKKLIPCPLFPIPSLTTNCFTT